MTYTNQIYVASPERYAQSETLYNRCGDSGVLLPKISLGMWHNFGGVDPYERSRAIARYAFDHGIMHFDLANNYGPPYGSAEETMGQLLHDDFAPYRHELFISTKAGYEMWDGPFGNGGSRKYLMNSLDESLRRMHLDYVDLFYSHRYDPNTPLEETMQTLVDIVRAGKALYVGLSNYPLEQLKKAHAYLEAQNVRLLIYQGKLNMLFPDPIEDGTLAYCKEHGIGFIAFSPLAQGLLTNRYIDGIPADSRMARSRFLPAERRTQQVIDFVREVEKKANAKGRTIAQEALSWILEQDVTSILVGASSVEQLKDNLSTIINY